MKVVPQQTVGEGCSCRMEFQLQDPDGTGVSNSNISAATMTLRNVATSAVINSRTSVNVASYFDSGGNFSFVLGEADNVIIGTGLKKEIHYATFDIDFTASGESHTLKFNFVITVVAEDFIT